MNLIFKLHKANEEKDLRYKLFNKYLLICMVFSLIILCIHIFNKRPLVNIFTAIILAVFFASLYYLSRYMGKFTLTRTVFLIIITFAYVPFGYLTSPGSKSAMMYMVIMVIFTMSFVAVKRYEIIYPLIVVIEALILLYSETRLKDFYYLYNDEAYRIRDLSLNFSIVAFVIIYTIFYVMSEISDYGKHLYKESITDGLTKLYNRRFLNDFISMEYDRSKRKNTIFSVVLMDLNNFKKVNDTYGHRTGDKVLEDISAIIQKNIRAYDVAARYGGDEFVIVFPDTEKEKVEGLMKRIIEEFNTYLLKYQDIRLSVAYGIEDSRNKELEEVYKEADAMLYVNKLKMKEAHHI